MVDDSNPYDGTFTSPTVLEDSSTYDSATHVLVVPSASDQYVITDPTSYDRVRNCILPYSIQYPTDMSNTTVQVPSINEYSITDRYHYSGIPMTLYKYAGLR